MSERGSWVGPWLRRADRPGPPACGTPGSGRKAEAQAEARERAAETHGDGARVFPSQRPTNRPAGRGAPNGSRFSQSPRFLLPRPGATAEKFLRAPLPASPHAAFHQFIQEDLLNAHSRRRPDKPGSLAVNLDECPRWVCS